MYCVSVLDLDASERIVVFEHPTRVDQALAVGRNVCELGRRQLGLEVCDCGGGGEGEDMLLVVGCLDVEGDLRLFRRRSGGVVGHGVRAVWCGVLYTAIGVFLSGCRGIICRAGGLEFAGW